MGASPTSPVAGLATELVIPAPTPTPLDSALCCTVPQIIPRFAIDMRGSWRFGRRGAHGGDIPAHEASPSDLPPPCARKSCDEVRK